MKLFHRMHQEISSHKMAMLIQRDSMPDFSDFLIAWVGTIGRTTQSRLCVSKRSIAAIVVIIAFIVSTTAADVTADAALYITPLINAGRLDDARSLSMVPPTADMNLESYAGYLTVKPPDNGHIFFWFFPALNNPETAPVILWMNGGPGLTAMSGLFAEIGPYFVDDEGHIQSRDINWVTKFNVIFMDTPLGTGFSHVKSRADMSGTVNQIGKDLFLAITQFFTVYSTYQGRDFYVSGESFASKYVIALATELESHTNSQSSSFVNLKGIILVSSFYDPLHQLPFADYAYQTGLISEEYRDEVKRSELIAQMAMALNLHTLASSFKKLQELGDNEIENDNDERPLTNATWNRETGMMDSDNILYDYMPSTFYTYPKFLDGTDVRRALHVGDVPFHKEPPAVQNSLVDSGDFTRSFRIGLQNLLDAGYKVLAMAGNMDNIIPPASSLAAAKALEWACKNTYQNAKRIIWKVRPTDKNSAGYVQCGCSYCNAMVRNAGHRLPGDEPERALDLVDRFINGRPFDV